MIGDIERLDISDHTDSAAVDTFLEMKIEPVVRSHPLGIVRGILIDTPAVQ